MDKNLDPEVSRVTYYHAVTPWNEQVRVEECHGDLIVILRPASEQQSLDKARFKRLIITDIGVYIYGAGMSNEPITSTVHCLLSSSSSLHLHLHHSRCSPSSLP